MLQHDWAIGSGVHGLEQRRADILAVRRWQKIGEEKVSRRPSLQLHVRGTGRGRPGLAAVSAQLSEDVEKAGDHEAAGGKWLDARPAQRGKRGTLPNHHSFRQIAARDVHLEQFGIVELSRWRRELEDS